MDSLTEKDPALVALVAPRLGVGSATSVGCFLLSFSYYARMQETNTSQSQQVDGHIHQLAHMFFDDHLFNSLYFRIHHKDIAILIAENISWN